MRGIGRLYSGLLAIHTIFILRSIFGLSPSPPAKIVPSEAPRSISHKIWQLWNTPVDDMNQELRDFVGTWTRLNPTYRYELFTHSSATEYILSHYQEHPDIVDIFMRIDDRILRADLFRYLLLFREGGLYTDIDTECVRPIDEWLSPTLTQSTRLLLGLEYDAFGGALSWDFLTPISFAQWTILTSPQHPVLRHVVSTVVSELQKFTDKTGRDKIKANNADQVLDLTGPRLFTQAVLEGISTHIGQRVTADNLSSLEHPRVFGDVTILPVSDFGSGQQHSNSQHRGNPREKSFHHFRGTWWAEHGKTS